MSALVLAVTLAFTCPAGATVDRAEGDTLVVLGAPGVHTIARHHVNVNANANVNPFGRTSASAYRFGPSRDPVDAVREGFRLRARPDGRCDAFPPDPVLLDRVRRRLAALARARH